MALPHRYRNSGRRSPDADFSDSSPLLLYKGVHGNTREREGCAGRHRGSGTQGKSEPGGGEAATGAAECRPQDRTTELMNVRSRSTSVPALDCLTVTDQTSSSVSRSNESSGNRADRLPKQWNPTDVESALYQGWVDAGYFHADATSDRRPF
ncbi:MAG TPA: valine--tRNA ligase, partial [Corynebacterium variabile]|nr:valine--tRNA ligase [Corynebacterium variabile]